MSAAPSNAPSAAPSAPPSAPPATSAPPPSTAPPPDTSIVTSTISPGVSTNVVTQKTTVSSGDPGTTVVVQTITSGGTTSFRTTTYASGAASISGTPIENSGGDGGGGGLSSSATTAIAVIIPVAVIALLVGLGIFFWKKRKQKKEAADQRRKEVEDYNYNPNHDPTLPPIGSEAGGAQMSEDHSSGYRGWGAAASSGRKMSTTLSGGHTQQLSDSGNSYGYDNPSSPVGGYSDGHSSDPMMNQRDTMGSDGDHYGNYGMAAAGAGAAGAAGAGAGAGAYGTGAYQPPTKAGAAAGGLRRGPSNASSAYSAGGDSDEMEEPPMPDSQQRYELPANNYGFGQHGPYGDGTYGGAGEGGMPVVRDLNAKRNTRVNPGGNYGQGNNGISQNF